MRKLALFAGLVISGTLPALAAAQGPCDAPASDPWLKPGQYRGHGVSIRGDRIKPVKAHLPSAISLLKNRSVVALSDKDARTFLGADLRTRHHGFKAYLVRAVFPSANPTIDADLEGNDLFVFAGGMGCAAFVKHPIVIFLERKPKRVFVSASSAL